jgi:hypothetical protein
MRRVFSARCDQSHTCAGYSAIIWTAGVDRWLLGLPLLPEGCALADGHEWNAVVLREKASAFRRLAREILDGPFRSNLLALARDYDRRAAGFDRAMTADQESVTAQGRDELRRTA